MYSAYKLKSRVTALTYSFPNLGLVCNCCFLTCIQISQEAGKVVWYSYLLKNFPQFVVIHTVKGFGIVNKAEVDVFLEFSFFRWPNRFWQFDLCFPCLFEIQVEHLKVLGSRTVEAGLGECWASMWDECNCVVVWSFFAIAFLWDWNENWIFPVPWPLLSFPNLLAYWVQHSHGIIS